MDHGKVINRAWAIIWRWRILWVLGLLASLGSGGGSGTNFQFGSRAEMPEWLRNLVKWDVTPEITALLIGLGLLALLVGLVLWLVAIIARGGLVAGVQQIEEEGTTSFARAWRVGRDRFWTLLGIAILTMLPILVLGLLVVGGGIVLALASGMFEGGSTLDPLPFVSLFCCGGPLLLCGVVIVAIALTQIRIYAENAAVQEGLDWVDSVRRGWQVLRDNLGATLVMWLIFWGIGIALGLVLGVAGMIVIGPLFALTFTDVGALRWIPLIIGGTLFGIVGLFVGSVMQTFFSAVWTLTYRDLTGLPLRAVEKEGEEAGSAMTGA